MLEITPHGREPAGAALGLERYVEDLSAAASSPSNIGRQAKGDAGSTRSMLRGARHLRPSEEGLPSSCMAAELNLAIPLS